MKIFSLFVKKLKKHKFGIKTNNVINKISKRFREKNGQRRN